MSVVFQHGSFSLCCMAPLPIPFHYFDHPVYMDGL